MLLRFSVLGLILSCLAGCGVLYYKMPEAHLDPAKEVVHIKSKLLQKGIDTIVVIGYLQQNTYIEPVGPRPKMPIDIYWKSKKGKYWFMKISTYGTLQSEVPPFNLTYFNKGYDTILYPPSYPTHIRGIRRDIAQEVQLHFHFAGSEFTQNVIRIEDSKHPIQVFLTKKDAISRDVTKDHSKHGQIRYKRQWVWKE